MSVETFFTARPLAEICHKKGISRIMRQHTVGSSCNHTEQGMPF